MSNGPTITTTEKNGNPTTMSAAEQQHTKPTPITIEYGKETLKFLSEELERLHKIVGNNPDTPPQWAVEQIRLIHTAVISGTPIHNLPAKQTK